MRHLVLPAKIIGVLWFVFAITILPSLQSLNQQGELLVFALNVLGAASIAFVYGHSRGKKGLTAGWIGKVFLALLVLLPLVAMSSAPLLNILFTMAMAAAFIVLFLYLPYRAGSKLGYREYEAAQDEAA